MRDTARMIIQQFVLKTIMQALNPVSTIFGGGFLGSSGAANIAGMIPSGQTYGLSSITGGNFFSGFGFASGAAVARNGIVPYAMGGLVTKPTIFRYANGGVPATGLMGEAGPEAIMPLRRLPNGRLGVESANGGSPITVNVSVDAKGTSIEGNDAQARAFAGIISAGVQAEIVKQQRPGGLLAGTR